MLFRSEIADVLGMEIAVETWAKEEGIAEEEVIHRITAAADAIAADKADRFGDATMRYIEKAVLLQTLDHLWREHLVTLDHLRQVIGFRGYAQRDPLNEYKTEAFELFSALLSNLRREVTKTMMRVELVQQEIPADGSALEEHHLDASTGRDQITGDAPLGRGIDPADPSTWGSVSRNAPCPCGSGKKYKHCHGAFA